MTGDRGTYRKQVFALAFAVEIAAAPGESSELFVDGFQEGLCRGQSAIHQSVPESLDHRRRYRTVMAHAGRPPFWRSESTLPARKVRTSQLGSRK